MPWQEEHMGKQLQDLSEQEQKQADLRYVCEGCSLIVASECDLVYVSDEENQIEFQYCSDCAELYNKESK